MAASVSDVDRLEGTVLRAEDACSAAAGTDGIFIDVLCTGHLDSRNQRRTIVSVSAEHFGQGRSVVVKSASQLPALAGLARRNDAFGQLDIPGQPQQHQ